jgi:hypothetical protein
MPMPMTRPIQHNATITNPPTMQKGGTPAPLALPPSKGVALPYGQPTVHTVKDPAHVVPMPTRAAVT